MRRLVLAAALLAVVVLAGCVSGPGGCVPPRSARAVAADAPSEGGFGADLVKVHVTTLAGMAVPGAAVVVVWNRDYIDPPDDEDDVVPNAPPLEYLDLRTDSLGEARAFLPRERYVIVTAAADGSTEEWSSLLSPGSTPTTLRLQLFPETLVLQTTGTYPAGVANAMVQGRTGEDSWRPTQLPWGLQEPQAMPSAFALRDRLAGLDAWLSWSTDPVQVAELGLGVGSDDTSARAGNSEGGTPRTGEHNVTVTITDDGDLHLLAGTEGPWAGPYLAGTLVSQEGIPYQVGVIAHLDRRAIAQSSCGVLFPDSDLQPASRHPDDAPKDLAAAPFAGLAVAMLALAVAVRRRRMP